MSFSVFSISRSYPFTGRLVVLTFTDFSESEFTASSSLSAFAVSFASSSPFALDLTTVFDLSVSAFPVSVFTVSTVSAFPDCASVAAVSSGVVPVSTGSICAAGLCLSSTTNCSCSAVVACSYVVLGSMTFAITFGVGMFFFFFFFSSISFSTLLVSIPFFFCFIHYIFKFFCSCICIKPISNSINAFHSCIINHRIWVWNYLFIVC